VNGSGKHFAGKVKKMAISLHLRQTDLIGSEMKSGANVKKFFYGRKLRLG
jgi:hypothetical protein